FWWLSPIVIAVVVLLAAIQWVPIVQGALIGVVLLMVFRVLGSNEAYASIHWQVIILIAAMIPMGFAIESTGTANVLGKILTQTAGLFPGNWQPHLLLALVYLITVFLTEKWPPTSLRRLS
ncbi:MAG: hypothetical protein GXO90_01870, partial [FCB group bacterium]|nr:hypothetical protein [FCB group bacterium]